jgi:methyl-accepting chemotaxis protein
MKTRGAVKAGLEASKQSSETFVQIEQATSAMKRSVDAVHDAADDQQMLVGIVRSRIADNEAHTQSVATHTASCVTKAQQMVEAASNLSNTTKKFIV